jgi:hypothetical protein
MTTLRITFHAAGGVEVSQEVPPAFDGSSRWLPLELAAEVLGVSLEAVMEAANLALFPTTVEASGLRVAKLRNIALALSKMHKGGRP